MAEERGRAVRAGDVLAEIETDKATMEVEAVDEGVLAKIVIPEGTEHVAVNTPIALIAGDGEDVADAAEQAPQRRPQPPAKAPAAEARCRPPSRPQRLAAAAPPARRAGRTSPNTPARP